MKVLVVQPGYSFSRQFNNIEAFISLLDSIYGVDCSFLACNGAVLACGMRSGHNKDLLPENTIPSNWKSVCNNCQCKLLNRIKHFCQRTISVDKILTPIDIASIKRLLNQFPDIVDVSELIKFTYNGVIIGQEIRMSLQRFLFMGNPGKIQCPSGSIAYEYIRTGITYAHALEKILCKEKFDLIIANEIHYVDWGIPVKFSLKHGIPVIRLGGGYFHGHIRSSIKLYQKLSDLSDYFFFPTAEEFKRILLDITSYKFYEKLGSSAIMKWMTQYSNNEILQKAFANNVSKKIAPIPDKTENLPEIRKWFRSGKKTVVIFTKTCWETTITFGGMIFSTLEDWIITTYKIISTIDQIDWIIRIHPYEENQYINPYANTIKLLHTLQKKYPCSHIRIMSSSCGLKTYDIIPYMHAGVATMGTLPMELGSFGIPCIYPGNKTYSVPGFTYCCDSIRKYEHALRNIGSLNNLTEDQRKRAMVFAGFPFDKARFLDMWDIFKNDELNKDSLNKTMLNQWVQHKANRRLLKQVLSPIAYHLDKHVEIINRKNVIDNISIVTDTKDKKFCAPIHFKDSLTKDHSENYIEYNQNSNADKRKKKIKEFHYNNSLHKNTLRSKKENLYEWNNKIKYMPPNHVILETISDCNRKCCPNAVYTRQHHLMPENVFKSIIDQLKELSFSGRLTPTFYSEPLLDKRLLALFKYAKKQLPEASIGLCTNGDFLTSELTNDLLSTAFDDIRITQHSKKFEKEKLINNFILQYPKFYERLSVLRPNEWVGHNRGGHFPQGISQKNLINQCPRFSHLVIDCYGNTAICCNDFFAEYGYGSVINKSLKKIWKISESTRKKLYLGEHLGIDICRKCVGLEEKNIDKNKPKITKNERQGFQSVSYDEVPTHILILITNPRSGSTWLTDALRCHPDIEFLPSGSICRALNLNQKKWGRYPRDLSNTPNSSQSIEITNGKWGHIPQFDITNQFYECPKNIFSETFAIEKIHPEFFDFNATTFLENLQKIEDKGVKIRLIYLVRDPEASFTSFMNYQERNPTWYPKTRNDSLATYMLKTYDAILKISNCREGLVVDYGDVKANLPNVLQKIYRYLWPDVNQKEMDLIIQLSHAAHEATARDKRLAISNSSFIGATIGSIRGGADKHRDFFNLYKDKVEICYNRYHCLLNKNSKQYQIEKELDNQLLLGEKLFNEGKHNEAEIILKNILNEEPSHSIAHNNLGCLLWQTNRKLEAITELKKAFELTPNNPDVVWNIGQSFIEIGYLNEAINLYQTYLNINPNDKRILKAIQNSKNQDLEDILWLIINKKDIIENIIDDIKKRLAFYVPHIPANRVEVVSEFPQKALSDKNAILLFGSSDLIPHEVTKARVFNIDYRHNPTDGWDWCKLANYCSNHKVNIEESKLCFTNYINKLKKELFNKAYIFGTGPSLEKAIKRDWSDGYRIVCNTIVRDPILWKHINPHFIVAGDAIYHFGHTEFAQSFRQDLAKRLNETETYFLYPEFFHEIVRREFNEFLDRLIPVPKESNQQINVDLSQYFALPALHNVLGLLLLPLACTLSKNIYLWGFDGRAPDDKLFWNNSKKHSYPEFIPKLQKAHPCFFNYFVPKADTGKYTQIAFGDLLDKLLRQAESEGFTFVMMHKSWTPNLQKRYQKKNSSLICTSLSVPNELQNTFTDFSTIFGEQNICPNPFLSLEIHGNGNVSVCCTARLKRGYEFVGNILQSSLNSIWNSSQIQNLRQLMYEGKYDKCCKPFCPQLIALKKGKIPPWYSHLCKTDIHSEIMKKMTALSSSYKAISVASDGSCNLKCIMCRHDKKTQPTKLEQEVNAVTYNQILKNISNIRFLELTGNGDPFYSLELRKFLDRLTIENLDQLTLRFITNAQLLNEKRWEQIEKLNVKELRISVSIDAASQNTYESIRRGGKWDSLVKNLNMLAHKRSIGKLGLLQLTFCVMKRNIPEMIPFIYLAKSLNCDKIEFQRIFGSIAGDENIFDTNDTDSLKKLSIIMGNPIFDEDWIEASSLLCYRDWDYNESYF